MQTQLYVQVAEPCHENWNDMTEVNKGKFCASCQKKVVDFSKMTDVEVLNFFTNRTEETCGRFDKEQLMRPLIPTKIQQKKNWKWALAAATSFIFFTNRSTAQIKNKTTTPVTTMPVQNKSNELIGKVAFSNHSTTTIADTAFPKNKDCITGYDPTKNTAIMGLIIPAKVNQKVSWADTIPLIIQKVFNNETFSVNPNPVAKGGNLHLTVNVAGTYTVQLFDNNSRLVYVQIITVTAKGEDVYLQLPAALTSGNYYVQLINNANRKTYTDKVVVQ